MALRTAPNSSVEKLHKALAFQKSGEYEKAQRLYKQVLKKHPQHPDANHLLGVTYRQLGFPMKAIKQIEKAINLANDRAPFYSNLARAMSDIPNADNDSILALTRKALDLDPTLIDAWNLHAASLCKLELHEEAELIFQRLIESYPKHVDAYRNYGVMLRDQKEHEKAIPFLKKSILLDPDNPEPYVLLAKSWQDTSQLDDALDLVKKALERFPGNDSLHHEYARICFKQGNAIEGLDSAILAAAASQRNIGRQVTLGVCLLGHSKFDEAISAFKRALDLAGGDLPTAEWNLSLAYLGKGDLENGWALHKARFLADDLPVLKRKFNKPAWEGESLEGKTLVVYADQGVGDALRASTILPEIIEEADKVIIEASQKLIAPFKESFPEATVRIATFETGTMEPTAEDYDCQTAMADLQCYKRPTFVSFNRARHPSLKANSERVRELYSRIPDADQKPIVGISWRSRNLAPARVRNYFSVLDFAPIVEVEDVIFLNLQYSCVPKELRYLESKCINSDFVHLEDVDQFNNLADAGALIRCCDLVVTAPTSVSDLAGCHNVPCWSFGDPQAHYTLGQEVPLWYPSVNFTPITPQQSVADRVPEIVERLTAWKKDFSPEQRLKRVGL
jgi:tetratricopeptide (TPR) repeat protein